MCFHFYNLQPLVDVDNLTKSCKYKEDYKKEYIDTFTDAVKVEDKNDFFLWIRRNEKKDYLNKHLIQKVLE